MIFRGTQERVQNSRGKRGKQAISVRATEALLYSEKSKNHFSMFFFL